MRSKHSCGAPSISAQMPMRAMSRARSRMSAPWPSAPMRASAADLHVVEVDVGGVAAVHHLRARDRDAVGVRSTSRSEMPSRSPRRTRWCAPRRSAWSATWPSRTNFLAPGDGGSRRPRLGGGGRDAVGTVPVRLLERQRQQQSRRWRRFGQELRLLRRRCRPGSGWCRRPRRSRTGGSPPACGRSLR